MELLTNRQKELLLNNGKPENRDKDHAPVVKLFLPGTGCTWLLSELDHEEPTIAFGLCDLGMYCPELGYVSLTELKSVKSPQLRLPVERDIHFVGRYPLSVYAEAARLCAAITEDKHMLSRVAQTKGLPIPKVE